MDELIRWLRGKADFVLLDTAPALIAADALALAAKCDGAVIVADAQKTTQAALAAVRHELSRVGVPIIGAILNRLGPAQAKRYPDQYGAYYSSSYRYRARAEKCSRTGHLRDLRRLDPQQMFERESPAAPERVPETGPEATPDVVELDPAEQVDPRERMWRS